jgi:hypothetical protein
MAPKRSEASRDSRMTAICAMPRWTAARGVAMTSSLTERRSAGRFVWHRWGVLL